MGSGHALTRVPALLFQMRCIAHTDLLTGKLDFLTFPAHGKPPFGCGMLLVDTTVYALETRFALS